MSPTQTHVVGSGEQTATRTRARTCIAMISAPLARFHDADGEVFLMRADILTAPGDGGHPLRRRRQPGFPDRRRPSPVRSLIRAHNADLLPSYRPRTWWANRAKWRVARSEGHLESVEWPRGRSGRCPGGQAEVREDLGDHGGIFDGGDELQGAAALRALLDVDLEYPLEQPGLAQAHRRHGRGRLGVVG